MEIHGLVGRTAVLGDFSDSFISLFSIKGQAWEIWLIWPKGHLFETPGLYDL